MKTTKIKIQGMSCANCVTHVQKALEAVPSVTEVNTVIGEVTVQHENASDEQLIRAIRAAGDYQGQIV